MGGRAPLPRGHGGLGSPATLDELLKAWECAEDPSACGQGEDGQAGCSATRSPWTCPRGGAWPWHPDEPRLTWGSSGLGEGRWTAESGPWEVSLVPTPGRRPPKAVAWTAPSTAERPWLRQPCAREGGRGTLEAAPGAHGAGLGKGTAFWEVQRGVDEMGRDDRGSDPGYRTRAPGLRADGRRDARAKTTHGAQNVQLQHARCVQDAGCCGPGRDRVRGTGRPLGRAPPVTVTAEWSAGRGRTALGLSRPPSWRLGLTPLAATCQHVAGWPCGCPQPLHRWTRGGCLQGARPSSGAVTLGAFLGQPPGRRHCQSPLGRRGHRTLPCSIPQGLLVVLTKEGLFLY